MARLASLLDRLWGLGPGPLPETLDPVRKEALRAVEDVFAVRSVREALDADGRADFEELVREEAVASLLRNRAFTESLDQILQARRSTLAVARPFLRAVTQRRRLSIALRIIATVLPVALGVGVYLKVSASVGAGAMALVLAVAAILLYAQVRVAQMASYARQLQWRAEREEKKVWRQLIANVAVLDVFATINRLRGISFSHELEPIATDGLADLFDPQYEVSITATDALCEALTRLRAGSLGIAGSRGAGKTTLIRAACSGQLELEAGSAFNEGKGPPLGVMVSAPVRYEAREFVPHVFGELCLEVRGTDSSGERYRQASGQFQRAGRALLAASGFLVSVYLYLFARYYTANMVVQWISLIVAVATTALLGVRLFDLIAKSKFANRGRLEEDSIQAQADRHLKQLRYLETRANEWSGEVGAKGAKLGTKASRSLAAQPLTLPELTALYQQFVRAVTVDRPLIVGIDELDKMASPKEVRSFLNDIKSLFGQSDTYYLVSVSEQAMSAFERRGLPIRDVFDSVFDDVLHVGNLQLKESEALLQQRVIGMGPPFAALCHCMAGGLPRELIRCARKAVAAAERSSGLTDVTAKVIGQRVEAQQHAVEVAVWAKIDRDGRQPVVSWLNSLPDLGGMVDAADIVSALLDRCCVNAVLAALDADSLAAAGEDEPSADVKPRLAVIQLATSWYQEATVLEFFAGLDASEFEKDREWTAEEQGHLELLCRAQQQLASSIELAWNTVSELRLKLALAPILPFPVQAGEADQVPEPA